VKLLEVVFCQYLPDLNTNPHLKNHHHPYLSVLESADEVRQHLEKALDRCFEYDPLATKKAI
jgi:hypothetical protein